jgi:hypothetical protein
LQEAKATVTTGYKGDKELLQQMESIGTLTTSLLEEMRKIKSK